MNALWTSLDEPSAATVACEPGAGMIGPTAKMNVSYVVLKSTSVA